MTYSTALRGKQTREWATFVIAALSLIIAIRACSLSNESNEISSRFSEINAEVQWNNLLTLGRVGDVHEIMNQKIHCRSLFSSFHLLPQFPRGWSLTVPPLSSASILVNMFTILTGFTYRGLSPHKFTPMPGVHKAIQRTRYAHR
jgi:hypothetical protein